MIQVMLEALFFEQVMLEALIINAAIIYAKIKATMV
jgi:hypothetical protein